MSKQASPTLREKSTEPVASFITAVEEKRPNEASYKLKNGEEQQDEEVKEGVEVEEVREPPMTPSAIKGKSGRERSTDIKLRFDPNIRVMETPSYALVMNHEEGDDETEEVAVFDRLYEEAKKRAERLKTEIVNKGANEDDAEAKECTFSPVVSDYAKQQGKYSTWDDFLRNQNERKKMSEIHFQKKKEKLLNDELLPLFEDMPRKHSLRIISYLEKERNYKGPIKGWRERFRKYMKRLNEQDADSSSNKSKSQADTSSVHSGIIRDDAVFDRLYDEAVVRAAARRVVMLTQLEKEARELYHPITNESEYWGSDVYSSRGSNNNGYNSTGYNISERESCLSSLLSNRTGSVFEDLYAMGKEYHRRRELRAMEAMENQEQLTFKPVTNPQSSRIIMERAIARAKGELPERSKEKERLASDDNERSKSREGKPNIKFNPDIFCSRLQRRESERLGRLAAVRRQLRMKEVMECTFRPSISRNSHAMAVQKGYAQITFTPSSDPTTEPTPKLTRSRTTGAEYGGGGGVDYEDIDISNTTKRRVNFTPSERVEGRFSQNKEGHTGVKVSPGHVYNNGGVQDDYISALSSEIQGVLSQWTETAEQAKSTV